MAERQMITSVDQSRPDHTMRYRLAIEVLRQNGLNHRVLDAGCGVGYGSNMMSEFIDEITCVDISPEAYDYFKKYFSKPNIDYLNQSILDLDRNQRFDAIVCFEFIEHVTFSEEAVKLFGQLSDVLIISSPNELVRPWAMPPINPYHVRHYTPDELEDLLALGGFKVQSWYCQMSGGQPEIHEGNQGKFMIAVASK